MARGDGVVELPAGSGQRTGQDLTAVRAPDMRLWRYGGGLDVELLNPEMTNWKVTSSVGVGATSFDSQKGRAPSSSTTSDFNKTYFTAMAGLRLGYESQTRWSAYVGADANWANADMKETVVLRALDPATVRALSSAWSIPLTLGVRVRT